MKVAYFDCVNGISGDMLLGAMLSVGVEKNYLLDELAKLGLEGYSIDTGVGNSYGIAATYVKINVVNDQPHRHYSDILNIIENSKLQAKVIAQAKAVFKIIAEAEAKIHGTTVDKVHFHEVGAIDSICDIVGSLVSLNCLGVEKVISSPLPIGLGTIQCAHGTIPLPAPATLEILKGVPIRETTIEGELVTPTGAALAVSLSTEFKTYPDMVINCIGYGMGEKDFGHPNILRIVIGEI
jgi:pyridinium-3,5-bisthiocarboxylic acid mononucleotide nickel chelatase